MIKILVVDDQRLMREGLKTILEFEEDIKVVGLAENGQDALDKISLYNPDLVLLDIRMPIMNGVECTQAIKEKYPYVKVLILTTFDDDEYIIEGLRNGAEGYLLKDLTSEKLISAIKDVYGGNSIIQPEIASKIISHITVKRQSANLDGQIDQLTEREIDVFKLLGKGLNNKEIAESLYISEGTVKNYISTIYDKIGIKERSKAILYAIENKYVDE
ncbi:response regulator transcription factor [Mycoplasmatota bacterium]|nr:response regulator transcription factor [Mycoplasmatota bacterium]